jgi:N-terminal acetyltransferase B complex catalytic subunit|tara:strand:- start:2419 stop:3159 length:741 start_codon:yes stop_codon:yes gene_type:complete
MRHREGVEEDAIGHGAKARREVQDKTNNNNFSKNDFLKIRNVRPKPSQSRRRRAVDPQAVHHPFPTRPSPMTTIRHFTCDDLFTYNDVNTDVLTETFNLNFYLGYLATWPEYFSTAKSPSGTTMGYVMGKAEGKGTNWHGHVTAVTVAPSYRRMGLAKTLMRELETISQEMHDGFFVDLFVRKSNVNAIAMYAQLGYRVYRTVLDYYSGEEDALDMRFALRRDREKKSMVPLPKPVRPWELGEDFS